MVCLRRAREIQQKFCIALHEEKSMTSGQCGEISASGVSRVAEHEEPRLHGILFNNLFGHSGCEHTVKASWSAVRGSSICYIRGKLASL